MKSSEKNDAWIERLTQMQITDFFVSLEMGGTY